MYSGQPRFVSLCSLRSVCTDWAYAMDEKVLSRVGPYEYALWNRFEMSLNIIKYLPSILHPIFCSFYVQCIDHQNQIF